MGIVSEAAKHLPTFEEQCESARQDRDHFPDIAEGSVFPVWVRVERINERV
jgi:hypothetical protein